MRPYLRVSVLAAMVLVATGALALLTSPPPPGHPGEPMTAESEPVGAWTPTDGVPEPWDSLTWTRPDPAPFDMPGNTFVVDATAWRAGFIAVGYTIPTDGSDGVAARIWTSRDGIEWQRDPRPWEGFSFQRVVRIGDTLAILGQEQGPAIGRSDHLTRLRLWKSNDATTWIESPLPAELAEGRIVQAAAVAGDRWLLRTVKRSGEVEWLRRGDRDWTVVAVESVASGTNVYGITGAPEGWLAFGTTGDPPQPGAVGGGDPSHDRGAIWRSADGEHWEAADIARPGTSIGQLVRIAKGWIAVGSDHHGCPRCVGHEVLLWQSSDARSWVPLPVRAANSNSFGGTILVSDGRRAIAFDTLDDGRVRTRTTTDATSWSEVGLFLAPPMGAADLITIHGPVVVGPGGVVTFDHVSRPDPPEHAWVVPYVGRPGDPPDNAVTQAPRPLPGSQDRPCLPAGQECG